MSQPYKCPTHTRGRGGLSSTLHGEPKSGRDDRIELRLVEIYDHSSVLVFADYV